MTPTEIARALEKLAQRKDADAYIFSAEMRFDYVDRLRTIICEKRNRRENAVLFITTLGGDPDSAYRLAACLQHNYKNICAYVFGMCKSAGTLTLLGAHEVVIGDHGELGPLDVQLTKPDELVPASSGLDIFQALGVISDSAFESFQRYFLQIITNSQGSISAKTAAEIAREIAVGLFAPMTSQIDPERLGEVQRAINIANAYGAKLNRGNLRPKALERLVQGYPNHGFVIDLREAKHLFTKVRAADALETSIATVVSGARKLGTQPVIGDLIVLYAKPTGGPRHVTQPKAKAQKSNGKRAGVTAARRSGRHPALSGNAARHAALAKGNNNAVDRAQRRPNGRA